ncbi:MAG: transglycosylase SLT domain-containing protein [Rhodobacteraceae bacterium]|nr:transglycosylase SLT domain-containing protein [Paracoccaceae bacterium]
MSSRLAALSMVVLLSACGGMSPPRNLDNACSIVSERPQYLTAMRRTQSKWGVPVHVQMAVIHQESKFDGDARTPYRYVLGVIPMGRQSSAYGYSQALDGTWEDYKRATGQRRASRSDIDDATDFIGWYMTETNRRLGIPISDARDQYLAYHEGPAGYARGSHNRKSWLLRTANRVEARSQLYARQLQACGKG